MTETTTTTTLWGCVDCLMYVANGDLPDPDELTDRDRDVINGYNEFANGTLSIGLMFGENDCEHTLLNWDADDSHSSQCETIDFSMRRCDICESHLGGSRHAFTLFTEQEQPCTQK